MTNRTTGHARAPVGEEKTPHAPPDRADEGDRKNVGPILDGRREIDGPKTLSSDFVAQPTQHEAAPADETTGGTPADEGTTTNVDPNVDAEREAPEDPQYGGSDRKGNPEAAKWRTRFREAEAERDQLRDRLATMQRTEAARLATGPGRLVDGDDVFRTAELADLLDDDGNLDPAKVTAVVDALVTAKPHLASPAFGDGVGVGERSPANGTTWASVIRG